MDKFPVNRSREEAPAPPPARAAGKWPARRIWTQAVLPLVLFVGLVVGVTLLKNSTPDETPNPSTKVPAGKEPISFAERRLIWDPAHPGYIGEFELETAGHHVFRFQNRTDEPAEIALKKKSCTCFRVELCLLSPEQAKMLDRATQLEQQLQAQAVVPGAPGQGGILHLIDMAAGGNDGYDGFLGQNLPWEAMEEVEATSPGRVVPPGTSGLVRLNWNGKGRKAGPARLTADFWTSFRGKEASRKDVPLEALVSFVEPVHIHPKQLVVRDWDAAGVGRVELQCWSATRLHFPFTAKARETDPCVTAETFPLTGSDCARLEKELRLAGEEPTHILSGYRVLVTVAQTKGGHQLEYGHFRRWIDLSCPLDPDLIGVPLGGAVRGDVTIGDETNRGVLDLGDFRRTEPARGTITIWASADLKFLPDKIEKKPGFLDVKLEKIPGASGLQQGWRLTVVIPPSKVEEWPEDAAVVLHALQGTQPRRIRIPVKANPYQ